jgi:hypothetical protein
MAKEENEEITLALLEEEDGHVESTIYLLEKGKLGELASLWPGKLGFKLNQLVGLYRYEQGRKNDFVGMTFGIGLVIGVIAACVRGFGYQAPFLEVAVTFAVCGIAGLFGGYILAGLDYRTNSDGPHYYGELKRFADALHAVTQALDLDLKDVDPMGIPKLKELVFERLRAWAAEIMELEEERDEAPSSEVYLVKATEIQKRRQSFARHYDAFASLKLVKGGFTFLFID